MTQRSRQKGPKPNSSSSHKQHGASGGRGGRNRQHGQQDRQDRHPDRQQTKPVSRHAEPISLKGRAKGEWFELKLPDIYTAAPATAILRFFPLPPKLAGKLLAEHGVQKNGVMLKLRLFPKERPGMEPDWMDMNILFEDEFMLIVNKPMGIEVHPSAHGQKGTLANAVAAYYEMTGKPCKVRPVHRLDKDTTGPVIFAKNEFANLVLEKAMKEKQVERLYTAIAEGRIETHKGVIDAPIGQDRLHSTRRRVSETGETAVTHYEVADRLPGHTLVRLRLETGRTHQIRVHLSHIGHPIAGDGMYGGGRKFISRQALHGEKLVCFHPWTGEKINVRAPLPDDMQRMLEQLRKK